MKFTAKAAQVNHTLWVSLRSEVMLARPRGTSSWRGRHRNRPHFGLDQVLFHAAKYRLRTLGDLPRHAALDLEFGALVEREHHRVHELPHPFRRDTVAGSRQQTPRQRLHELIHVSGVDGGDIPG